ncbi:hypothetical protein WEH80_37975 [Actinomycetes bacterium KLBMP 9759]
MTVLLPHPSWCDPAQCHTFTYPDDPTEVAHRAVLLDEPAVAFPGGHRQVDLIQMDTIARDGRSVARSEGPVVFVDHSGPLDAEQTSRLAAALQHAGLLAARSARPAARSARVRPPAARPGRRRLSIADRDWLWIGARTPQEMGDLPAVERLSRWQEAVSSLVSATAGGVRPAAYNVASDALSALTYGQALANHVLDGRWATARDALLYGAELRSVARAMGLHEAEARYGLRRWADEQREHGDMTDVEHDTVLELLADGGVS